MRAINISNQLPKHIIAHIKEFDEYFWKAQIEADISMDTIDIVDKRKLLSPINLSFCNEKAQHFLDQIKNTQPLLKACNPSSSSTPPSRIIDLTAGLGQDSLLLSTFKKPLVSIERNPLTAAILQTLVYQLLEKKEIQWTVINTCAQQWLEQQEKPCASHIYLDPFFHKRKSALPKNTMQWTQALSKEDPPSCDIRLLELALEQASQRVIVKRDKKANFINNKKPNQGSIFQKTSRFDCYNVIGS